MLSRATSRPAATSAVICSGPEVAGPRVHTIFARRFMAGAPHPAMRLARLVKHNSGETRGNVRLYRSRSAASAISRSWSTRRSPLRGTPASLLVSRGGLVAGICAQVADARDGLDGRGVAEFAAEPAEGDLDCLGERGGVLVPGLGEEVFGAEGGGGCFEEGREHGEFLDRDVDGLAVAGDGAAQRVEFYPGRAQDAGLGSGLAAGQG